MEDIMHYFPIILYLLGSILLVILIILGIKLIHTIDKTNMILDDAYNKTKSLNGIFAAIDSVTDTLSSISDSLVGVVSSIVGKVLPKKKKKIKIEEFEEDEEDE